MLTRLIRNKSLMIRTINVRAITNTSTDEVLIEEINNGGVITINNPKTLNALTNDMVRVIYKYLKSMESSKSLVIIKGAGEKAFCAGGNLRSFIELSPAGARAQFTDVYSLVNFISNYKIPYVALIDGITMGAGFGLSAHGKYSIATEKTICAMPENAIGLFPDVGSSHIFSRMNGKFGLYLALTGTRLKGKDIRKVGIASHFCESIKIPELENALLTCKTTNEIELVLQKFCPEDNGELSLGKYFKQINDCFSASTVEGIITRLKNDGSKWAETTIEILEKMCPTSLKITHRQLEVCSSLNLAQCLQMDYRIMVRSLFEHDFKEGLRAVIINKTNKPVWNPLKLSDVTEERVQFFFNKFPENEELKF